MARAFQFQNEVPAKLSSPLRKHLLIGTISAAVLGPVGLAVAAPCLKLEAARAKNGNSARQGGHHDPHWLTTTGCPRRAARRVLRSAAPSPTSWSACAALPASACSGSPSRSTSGAAAAGVDVLPRGALVGAACGKGERCGDGGARGDQASRRSRARVGVIGCWTIALQNCARGTFVSPGSGRAFVDCKT